MPHHVIEFVTTPNPNAMKCVLDHPLGEGTRSYFDAAAAAGDPFAMILFGVRGVTNVLIHESGWATVSKTPEVPWSKMKPAIEKALRTTP